MCRRVVALLMILVMLAAASGPASAAGKSQPAGGSFEVAIDFGTLEFSSVGANCLLQVEGNVEFFGTLEGSGDSVTEALVRAPCEDVLASPPGAFPDTFRSVISFDGTVDGIPASAEIVYHGTAKEGGEIRGNMNFFNGLNGVVRVDGQLAVGGTYTGQVVVH